MSEKAAKSPKDNQCNDTTHYLSPAHINRLFFLLLFALTEQFSLQKPERWKWAKQHFQNR